MATNMSKQDKHGARTAAELERKYNIGKTFAEVMGIATDAQQAADKAAAGVDGLDKKLDQTEVFNRLTNNGELQGIYRGDDGELYINATYIKSGEFVADLIKSGVIKSVDGSGSQVNIDLDNGTITVCGYNPKCFVRLFQETVDVYGDNTWAVYDSDGFQAENDITGNYILCSVGGTRSFLTGLTAPVNDADAVNKKYVDERSTNYIVSSGFAGSTGSATQIYFEKYSNGIIKVYTQIKCTTIPTTPTAAGSFLFSDVGMISLISCTASMNTTNKSETASQRLTADYLHQYTSPTTIQAVVQNLEQSALPTGETYTADLMIVGKWK